MENVINAMNKYQSLYLSQGLIQSSIPVLEFIIGLCLVNLSRKYVDSKKRLGYVMLIIGSFSIFIGVMFNPPKVMNCEKAKIQAEKVINAYSRKHPTITIAKNGNITYVFDKPISKLNGNEKTVAKIDSDKRKKIFYLIDTNSSKNSYYLYADETLITVNKINKSKLFEYKTTNFFNNLLKEETQNSNKEENENSNISNFEFVKVLN